MLCLHSVVWIVYWKSIAWLLLCVGFHVCGCYEQKIGASRSKGMIFRGVVFMSTAQFSPHRFVVYHVTLIVELCGYAIVVYVSVFFSNFLLIIIGTDR